MTTHQRLAQLRRTGTPGALCDAARVLCDAVEARPWISPDHGATLRLVWGHTTVVLALNASHRGGVSVVVWQDGRCAALPYGDEVVKRIAALVG